MSYQITIHSEDQGRDYVCNVTATIRPEVGPERRYVIDINRVELESVTVWLAKYGMDVNLDNTNGFVTAWERELEREWAKYIVEELISQYEASLDEPREPLERVSSFLGQQVAKFQRLQDRSTT